MYFNWSRKTDRFIKVRSSAKAQLVSVEVNSRPRMRALDPTLEFYLSLTVSFDFDGRKYICTKSPYEEQGISNSKETVIGLKNRVLNGADITVFFNPSCPDNSEESIAIVESILSWEGYKCLLIGKKEIMPQVRTPIFSSIFLALGLLVCLLCLMLLSAW